MATDLPVHPADRAPLAEMTVPFRPARPEAGLAVRLRRVIGIREDVLDWVPEERPRYTWYGVIVVNTALLAGVSMAVALATIRPDLPFPAVIVVAGVWLWLILALDSWLVSSTHGALTAKSPLRILLPRLALSVLLGIFIAEPLLFQIFDREIRQEIAVGNERRVADYRGMLVSCNPTGGERTTDRTECGEYQLKVPGSPVELGEQIKSNIARTKAMRTEVDSINRSLNRKMATEQRECARGKWIWWRGYADVSQTCERARADSSAYRATSEIKKYESDLAALVAAGHTLAAKKDTAAEAYQPALQRAIDTKTRQRATDLDDDGILTRAHALKAVAWSDWYAGSVALVLHLLLLVVDAMPVLAKLMSGSTTYDRLVTARFAASRRLHSDDLQVQHACATMEYEVQRHRTKLDTTDRMEHLEHEYRLAHAERALRFRKDLDTRTARILRERGD
ncbi:DUF4407 domain-containing protein [Streptomyces sp. NPDC050535]|uniref:DUF4407 domain-containing protein n=1 Tax=Streptomyces sp. NPDC050535 TaxID=3365626 RepID=UPI0037B9B2F7